MKGIWLSISRFDFSTFQSLFGWHVTASSNWRRKIGDVEEIFKDHQKLQNQLAWCIWCNKCTLITFQNDSVTKINDRNLPERGMLWMNDVINETPVVSVIVKIEVLGYKTPPETEALLNEFIDASIMIPLSDEIIDQTIQFKKAYKIKTPDAIITATAKSLGLTLISRNVGDFKNVKGLMMIYPWAV
ncbi:type II toxin-antitoxin system VapC family toxin [Mucilaginibacter sp. UC70_90]